MLIQYADKYPLYINQIIYAEISTNYPKIEELNAALFNSSFKPINISWEAAFLASKVYQHYRKSGGKATTPLPDFFIGAHALVDNLILLSKITFSDTK